MGMPPMNRPPMGGGSPPPDMGGAAPAPGMGGGAPMDFAGSLRELQQSLPPEMQGKLDPANPITQLTFKRLRDGISEEEGQALLNLFGNAEPLALQAAKKVWPEIMVLLDIFDDGELNDSVGAAGAPGAGAGAMPPGLPRPGGGEAPGYEDDDDDDDDDDDYGPAPGSRLSQIRA